MNAQPKSKVHNKFISNVPEQTAIFPLMLRVPIDNGRFAFAGLGTGFFISKWGLFVTAAHVLEEDKELVEGGGLEAWIVVGKNNFTCPVRDLQFHSTADIAIGCIVPPRDKSGKPPPEFAISLQKISKKQPTVSDKLFTYGYGRTQVSKDEEEDLVTIDMNPYYYEGEMLEYHSTGVSLAKWPVLRHSVPIASGVSGGPLMSKSNSAVVGVNCTGDSTNTEDIPHGMSTDIQLIFDMIISSQIPGFQGKKVQDILISKGLLV